MVGSINALSNMEYMLYGNTPGYGSINAPSMMNNYCMNLSGNYGFNPYMNQYYNTAGQYNPTFSQNIPGAYTAQQTNSTSNSVFAGLSTAEQNAIVNDYVKSMDPSESFMGAAAGAVGFSVLFHPRAIAHPYKTYKSFATTNELFKDIIEKKGVLFEAWKQPGTNEILREAYAATNRIDARALKERGFWHIRRNGFVNEKEYKDIRKLMSDAIDKYKMATTDQLKADALKEIQKATEQLNAANVKNGLLPRAWNGIKNIFTGNN